jgi:hypothetical protein
VSGGGPGSTSATYLSPFDVRVGPTSAQWYADVLGFEIRGDRFNEAAAFVGSTWCTRAG